MTDNRSERDAIDFIIAEHIRTRIELISALAFAEAILTQPVQSSSLDDHSREQLKGCIGIIRGDVKTAVDRIQAALKLARGGA